MTLAKTGDLNVFFYEKIKFVHFCILTDFSLELFWRWRAVLPVPARTSYQRVLVNKSPNLSSKQSNSKHCKVTDVIFATAYGFKKPVIVTFLIHLGG